MTIGPLSTLISFIVRYIRFSIGGQYTFGFKCLVGPYKLLYILFKVNTIVTRNRLIIDKPIPSTQPRLWTESIARQQMAGIGLSIINLFQFTLCTLLNPSDAVRKIHNLIDIVYYLLI